MHSSGIGMDQNELVLLLVYRYLEGIILFPSPRCRSCRSV